MKSEVTISFYLTQFVESLWSMLQDSALLLLIGLGLAGLMRLVLNEKNIRRFLPGNSRWSVIKAALLGIPLPLCSCSVLPVAYQLRQSGVGRGPTISFLISTPESGVDSIVLTYSLIDPLMTIARPVTAFLSALIAGLWESGKEEQEIELPLQPVENCSSGCDCDSEKKEPASESGISEVFSGLKYAYTDLIADLAPYLLIGYLLGAVVGSMWGAEAGGIPEFIRTGWGAYLGALVIGLPLYICATSSTPLAAALMAAGFSPGAALVFLIIGPATNVASLVVVRKILSNVSLARYLIVISVVAVLCGIGVDYLYSVMDIIPSNISAEHSGHAGSIIDQIAAIILSALILWNVLKILIRRLK